MTMPDEDWSVCEVSTQFAAQLLRQATESGDAAASLSAEDDAAASSACSGLRAESGGHGERALARSARERPRSSI